jgi:hypothetical protein
VACDKFGHPIALAIVPAGIRQGGGILDTWAVCIDQSSKSWPTSAILPAIEWSVPFCWNTRLTTQTTGESARIAKSALLADEMEKISRFAGAVT